MALATLQVIAITGARSSQAAADAGGEIGRAWTDRRDADAGDAGQIADRCCHETRRSFAGGEDKLNELSRSASMSGSTGPLGTPNTQRTPACSSMRTISSLLFIV